MDINEFQKKAKLTDQFTDKERSLMSSIWNLTETVGMLSRLYDEKGRHRDTDAAEHKEKMGKRLGDALWYLSNAASGLDIELEKIALDNLEKCQKRWGKKKRDLKLFDESYPIDQQLPRKTTFRIEEDKQGKVRVSIDLKDGGPIQLGARVTDNSYSEDGYRFHDVIHLTFMTILGWSPVMRALMSRKRKNRPEIDEVEDGARAINLEEAVSAMIYEHAREVKYFEHEKYVSFDLLKWIERITRGLEVSNLTYELWNEAITTGYAIWRETYKNKGGFIDVDLNKRQIKYRKFEHENS